MAAGANGEAACLGGGGGLVSAPPNLAAIFSAASARYSLGPEGAAILAGLTLIVEVEGKSGLTAAFRSSWVIVIQGFLVWLRDLGFRPLKPMARARAASLAWPGLPSPRPSVVGRPYPAVCPVSARGGG